MTSRNGHPRRVGRLLNRILSGVADRNIRFDELRLVLLALQFEERVRGSHHIFTRAGILEILNLQQDSNGKSKPYQVRQVRAVIVSYRLAEELLS